MSALRFIPLKVHGVLDYAVAATLIIAPFLLRFDSALAHWVSVGAGVALVAYSLLTDYSMGARALISFRLHLVLDFMAGATFVVLPYLVGFEGVARMFYVGLGAAVMAVVMLSNPDTKEADERMVA